MHFISFIIVVCVSVVLPWWLVLPIWVFYGFRFGGYELIALGVLLDAYFGYGASWNVFYVLAAVVICIVVAVVKPRMRFSSSS